MGRSSTDWRYWVAFQQTPQVGPSRLGTLRARFGDDLEQAWRAPVGLLSSIVGEAIARSIVETRGSLDLDALVARIERSGADVLTLDDPRYPPLLLEAPVPPPVLYCRGEVQPGDVMSVAIVGTRRTTDYGREVTRVLAHDLAQAGVTIVSGLAYGVDTVAHDAALSAGGRTIGVLGCGIDIMYPRENERLARRMLDQGAILSEHPPGTQPDARFFPARNRIVAGMTRGTIVVEAPVKSGALITSDFAAAFGRDVFAVPGNVFSESSAGCHALLRDGAVLTTCAADVLAELGFGAPGPERVVQAALPMNEGERVLLALLTPEPKHIDDIAAAAQLSISEVSTALLMMELQGLVRNAGAQHYARAR
jgi:DNA processing protein